MTGMGDMFADEQPAAPTAPAAPAQQAAAILDAAEITGKERLEAIKDVKAGALTTDELASAYPATKIQEAVAGNAAPPWVSRRHQVTSLRKRESVLESLLGCLKT